MKMDRVTIEVKTTGVEETVKELKVLRNALAELRKWGIKKKTLNLIVKNIMEGDKKNAQ